jgi:hypothetical protein
MCGLLNEQNEACGRRRDGAADREPNAGTQ